MLQGICCHNQTTVLKVKFFTMTRSRVLAKSVRWLASVGGFPWLQLPRGTVMSVLLRAYFWKNVCGTKLGAFPVTQSVPRINRINNKYEDNVVSGGLFSLTKLLRDVSHAGRHCSSFLFQPRFQRSCNDV